MHCRRDCEHYSSCDMLSHAGTGRLTRCEFKVQAGARDKLGKLRAQFFGDLRRQLYTDEDDKSFYDDVQASLKTLGEQLEQGAVAAAQLEQHLLNVTCDDPGATVGMGLILPLLQARLDELAAEHAAREARRAEVELLRQSVRAPRACHFRTGGTTAVLAWPLRMLSEDRCSVVHSLQQWFYAC
jgi:hypothetical protein